MRQQPDLQVGVQDATAPFFWSIAYGGLMQGISGGVKRGVQTEEHRAGGCDTHLKLAVHRDVADATQQGGLREGLSGAS